MKGLLLNYDLGMWDATLTGKKTNTRRAHKSLYLVNKKPDDWEFVDLKEKDGLYYARFQQKGHGNIISCRARYAVGEIAYLQEPTMNLCPYITDTDSIVYRYRDHKGETPDQDSFAQLISAALKKGAEWGNKMGMAEIYARYYVKFTKICVERLNDISDADCLAEGIEEKITTSQLKHYAYGLDYKITDKPKPIFDSPKKAYLSLNREITPPKDFIENPWVFSYHYELTRKP